MKFHKFQMHLASFVYLKYSFYDGDIQLQSWLGINCDFNTQLFMM